MINDGCAGLRDLRPEVQKRTPAALTRREKKTRTGVLRRGGLMAGADQ